MIYFFTLAFLFVAILVYFRIAIHYKIIDMPNERSSHRNFTIRGGGIIFLFSMMIAVAIHFKSEYYLPMAAALLIGTVSFVDDRISLSRSLRLFAQILSVALLFFSLDIFDHYSSLWLIGILFVVTVGTINAYNFMDGINGMTGLYSLVVLGGLQVVNLFIFHFIEPDMIWMPMLACVVFLFFNFRKKAKCFAGDVGSISMAFWVTFLLLKLIVLSGQWTYILFLSVYGVETVLTISHRLFRKENIFKPHRIHLFQMLANEAKWPQLLVSGVYALIQMSIIGFYLAMAPVETPILLTLSILFPLSLVYVFTKPSLMKLRAKEIAIEERKSKELAIENAASLAGTNKRSVSIPFPVKKARAEES